MVLQMLGNSFAGHSANESSSRVALQMNVPVSFADAPT